MPSSHKKMRFPRAFFSVQAQEVQTVWWAMVSLVVVCLTYGILGILVDRGIIPDMHIGGPDYTVASPAMAGITVAILCAALAEAYRRGWQGVLSAVILLLSVWIVIVIPAKSFALGLPQSVWLGPMLAFAMTSLRFSLFTTLVTFITVFLAHYVHGAFHELTPVFVGMSITLLLVTSKRRHQNMMVAEREQAQATLKAAFYDVVTGLPNRWLIRDRLAEGIKMAARNGQHLAVIFVDIDAFKEVNDSLGHEGGDEILVACARRLGGCVRFTDSVGRFGTDVFAVLLWGVSERTGIDHLTDLIMDELRRPFMIGKSELALTASMGVAVYPDDGDTPDALLQNANQAVHNSKMAGGNRITYFTTKLQEDAQYRLRLTQDLRIALQEKQLSVHFQPIVDLRTGAVTKAEALVRWRHPSLGFVSPETFIPLAESSGLIHELGEWVFDTAAAHVKHWRTLCSNFQVSVNRSPLQFSVSPKGAKRTKGPQLNATWNERLARLGLPADSMALEITEGLLLDNGTHVVEQLDSLRAAGIRILLDDFGTGYSSLAYLQKFPIDVVKIDRAFVKDLCPTGRNFALCRAIVTMAHELGMKVVAEGVETAKERDLLKQVGCDFAQGFFFAKPMPADEFESFLMAA